MITISLITLALAAVITRVIQTYKFLKTVSKLCRIYDKKYVYKWFEVNPEIIAAAEKDNYHLTEPWSAYQWVFFSGPNPWLMPFLMKPLTIEGQYGKGVADKLAEYDVFE
jgi:hypothetical protein